MIRALHLIDDQAEYQSRRAASTLARNLGDDFAVDTLSSRSVATLAAQIRRRPHDVVHAWSARGLLAATIATKRPIVFSPPTDFSSSAERWMSTALAYRNVHVGCATAVQRHRFLRANVPPQRTHLILPGVSSSLFPGMPGEGRVGADRWTHAPTAALSRYAGGGGREVATPSINPRNDALRAALGFDETDFVLLAAGESTHAARHDHAVWAASILHVIDERNKLLLWGEGPAASRAAMQGRRMNQPKLCRVAEKVLHRRIDFDELLPACDAVLAPADGAVASLPLMEAMAAGRPIVATATPTLKELLEQVGRASLVPPGQPRLMAQCVLDLQTNAAPTHDRAANVFPIDQFIERHRALYQDIVA